MGLPENPPIYRNLVVIHYHLRPGGVRRIIELALPQIASAVPMPLESITLASGELPDAAWRQNLTSALRGTRLSFLREPAFRYLSEQRSPPEVIRRQIRSALERLTKNGPPDQTLIWAHNLGLARNLILSGELAAFSARRGLSLLSHHHDLWFENRWARWSEMRECGFRSLTAVARASFAARARVCHVTINQLDNAVLSKHLGSRARCLPNLAQANGAPSRARIRAARDWLASRLGDDGPVWISPTRFLRRKNLAEAVQLTRWLRPEAWFVTTAGISSQEELRYARRLEAASRHGKWRGAIPASGRGEGIGAGRWRSRFGVGSDASNLCAGRFRAPLPRSGRFGKAAHCQASAKCCSRFSGIRICVSEPLRGDPYRTRPPQPALRAHPTKQALASVEICHARVVPPPRGSPDAPRFGPPANPCHSAG